MSDNPYCDQLAAKLDVPTDQWEHLLADVHNLKSNHVQACKVLRRAREDLISFVNPELHEPGDRSRASQTLRLIAELVRPT